MSKLESCNCRNYKQRELERERERESGLNIAACSAGKEECNDEEGYIYIYMPFPIKKSKTQTLHHFPSYSLINLQNIGNQSRERKTRDRENHSFAPLSVESTQFCVHGIYRPFSFHPTVIILMDPCMHICWKQAVLSATSSML